MNLVFSPLQSGVGRSKLKSFLYAHHPFSAWLYLHKPTQYHYIFLLLIYRVTVEPARGTARGGGSRRDHDRYDRYDRRGGGGRYDK